MGAVLLQIPFVLLNRLFGVAERLMLLLPGGPSCAQPRLRSRHRDLRRDVVCAGARAARGVSAICSCSDSQQEMRSFKAPRISSSRRQSHLVGLGLGLGADRRSGHFSCTGQPGGTQISLIVMTPAHLFKDLWFKACFPQC